MAKDDMAKEKKGEEYPAAFDDTDCKGNGNCKDCADKDICDVPNDDCYGLSDDDFEEDFDEDFDCYEFSDDDFYEDFENKSQQLGI